ncbi:uncharacterized protein LOC134766149 [Penaeus indicus]|uniref:uncharacterized protein LOC134766149 n=1 Tax=Penaeus indicus TaxID=29960 RepID=UPI00300CDB6E
MALSHGLSTHGQRPPYPPAPSNEAGGTGASTWNKSSSGCGGVEEDCAVSRRDDSWEDPHAILREAVESPAEGASEDSALPGRRRYINKAHDGEPLPQPRRTLSCTRHAARVTGSDKSSFSPPPCTVTVVSSLSPSSSSSQDMFSLSRSLTCPLSHYGFLEINSWPIKTSSDLKTTTTTTTTTEQVIKPRRCGLPRPAAEARVNTSPGVDARDKQAASPTETSPEGFVFSRRFPRRRPEARGAAASVSSRLRRPSRRRLTGRYDRYDTAPPPPPLPPPPPRLPLSHYASGPDGGALHSPPSLTESNSCPPTPTPPPGGEGSSFLPSGAPRLRPTPVASNIEHCLPHTHSRTATSVRSGRNELPRERASERDYRSAAAAAAAAAVFRWRAGNPRTVAGGRQSRPSPLRRRFAHYRTLIDGRT